MAREARISEVLWHPLSQKQSTSTELYAPMAFHHAPPRRQLLPNATWGRAPRPALGVRPIHFGHVTGVLEGYT